MLVVDLSPEKKLLQLLEGLRIHPDGTRSIHCKFSQAPQQVVLMQMHRAKIISLVQHHLTAVTPQGYFCEDGDLFILSAHMSSRDAHLLMLAIAEIFQLPVTDGFMEFLEVNQHINRLLVIVQGKLDAQQQAQRQVQQALAFEQLQRKREAILDSESHAGLRDIALRRHARETAELMLVEDDAFSRRLVENVLGKHFGMTSLATADEALATYARLAPDLLFLDINLPDVTGHELLARIIALDPDAHVVMLSGNADRENIARALKIGAKGFVAKPFTRDKLFQYINRCPTIPAEMMVPHV